MESDMLDRKKRRLRDRKEAEELKEKGNDAIKRGLYKSANKYYSDALELKKDLLPLYTNRALARLKLEDFTGVIDDCTRLLEYNEVFNDGFIKEKDLCFKALMRRCQALRGQKDFELALKDLEEAGKLYPEDKDVEKLRKLTLEDIELEKRVRNIMSNSELLKGKEYIDFLLDFLQGKKDDSPPAKQESHKLDKRICVHELTEEHYQKLRETLHSDKDIVYYFNVRDGFKVLVDSLFFN
jgi:tetratricopeptide (TPR) repeat protein